MAYKIISPQPVNEGGTGIASATAYAVLTGGTTSTGAFQSIASVGTAGQVLTSNGAGALPTFQASAGGIVTINGDTGSVTGSTVTLNGNSFSGKSVKFENSGSTLYLKLSDVNNNTVLGRSAGLSGTFTSTYNSGVGASCLNNVTSGTYNSCVGSSSLSGIQTGSYNTALGGAAGNTYTTGDSSNISIGYLASGTAGQSNNLIIGNGTGTAAGNINVATICGINGKTSASGVAVLVNSSNVLGTTTSSLRFKKNINDMGMKSSRIFDLRPVTFNYEIDGTHVTEEDSHVLQYGLIAEEVEKVIPEMVVYNKDGETETLRYQHLAPMLLNELQKAVKRIEVLEAKLAMMEK